MTSIWKFFGRNPRSRETTPKAEELWHLLKSLAYAPDVRDELNEFMIGNEVAILAIEESAQPFADLISISTYSTSGKPTYRATLRIRDSDLIDVKYLEPILKRRNVMVVDTSYNSENEASVEKEFGGNDYKLDGLMYVAPFPRPYARLLKRKEAITK